TDCSEPYASGTVVTLTAAPASGSTFDGWSGCDTASGATCTVTMSGVRMVGATFNVQRFTLTVNLAGTGSGTVSSSPLGISCGTNCSASYDSGTVVTLTASPAGGSTLGIWSGCDTAAGATCAVTMSTTKSVTLFSRAADALTVTPANPTIGVGQTQQFTANGALTPTAVAAGGSHTCMRLPDGTVQCWGQNNFGQLGNGDGSLTSSSVPVPVRDLTTATSVVTGDSHTCALLADGTVQCWGVGDSGQRGDGTFNNISTVPVAVVGMGGAGHLTNAGAVAARGYHSCALLGDGTVWCWGRNQDGQLGNGIPLPAPPGTQCPSSWCSSTPVRVVGITSADAITAGAYHTCALLSDRTVQCWGRNDDGQLGDGTRTSSSTPVRVVGITGAVAVTGGWWHHTCALLRDGTVQCWGQNDFGQLGNGTTTGSSTPVTMTGTGATWTSSNSAVATIDATGLATGVSPGTTTITATDRSGASASTTLTVRDQV